MDTDYPSNTSTLTSWRKMTLSGRLSGFHLHPSFYEELRLP